MRLALSHWLGPHNLGDLAILRAQLSLLRKGDSDLKIDLIALDSPSAQSAASMTDVSFESILILPWQGPYSVGWLRWLLGGARAMAALVDPDRLSLGRDVRMLRDLIRRVDTLMPKGGGYLYALSGARGVLFTARTVWPLLLARRLGVRRVLWGHSIGPCESWLGSLILKTALKGAQITVRDRASLRVLTKWGIPAQILPDMAFHLVADDPNAHAGRRNSTTRRIGLTARTVGRDRSDQEAYEERLRVSLNELVAEIRRGGEDVEVVGIVQVSGPTDSVNDRHVLSRILPHLDCKTRLVAPGADGMPTISQLLDAYAEVDLLVATRMHSAILASCVGRPFVVIEYIGGKARGIVDALGLPDWVYFNDDLTGLSSALARAWRERSELERQVRAGALEARRSVQRIIDTMPNPGISPPGVAERVSGRPTSEAWTGPTYGVR